MVTGHDGVRNADFGMRNPEGSTRRPQDRRPLVRPGPIPPSFRTPHSALRILHLASFMVVDVSLPWMISVFMILKTSSIFSLTVDSVMRPAALSKKKFPLPSCD